MRRLRALSALLLAAAMAARITPFAVASNEEHSLPDSAVVYRDLPYLEEAALTQTLDLFLPAADPEAGAFALIIWIRSGAERSGDADRAVPIAYLSDGYAVASVGYRPSEVAQFPAQLQDAKTAVRWLRKNADVYDLDPERFAAWGASIGGQLAALLGTTDDVPSFEVGPHLEVSSRVQAVVDYFGPTDYLQMEAQRAPELTAPNLLDYPESKLLGGPIQKHAEAAALANPIAYVTPDDPPFLIIHGDKDPLVPYQQSLLLEYALEQAGVPVTLYLSKGGKHGNFRDPKVAELTKAFLRDHLGAR